MSNEISPNRYPTNPSDKILHKEVIVTATLDQVWRAWTTNEGAREFFADDTNIELRPGGPFEILFVSENPPGQRGSEDCKMLSFLPHKMLAVEWNAPPEFGLLRYQYTQLIIQLEEIAGDKTRVVLNQHGWGTGEDWDRLYQYFDRAWGYVLNELQERFSGGVRK